MARKLEDLTNVNAPDSDYPYGRVKDRVGSSNNGTPVNEALLGDMTQFFAKMMDEADVTPNGLPDNEYSGFQLYEALQTLIDRAAPIGSIKMWGGAIAGKFDGTDGLGVGTCAGWALCNGSNGTVNLKGRFIVGYDPDDSDYNAIGDTGGAKTVTLDVTQIPAHTHSYADNGNAVAGTAISTGGAANLGDTTRTSGSTGGGGAHENRPPFYTLAFIQRIA